MTELAQSWKVEILKAAPLIAPVRAYTWPQAIAGEEDALARGALQMMVRPRAGGAYLVTAALGFRDPSMPTGIFACPDPDWICAVAGGYAYLASTLEPEGVTLLDMKPVVSVLPVPEAGLLVFVGFQTMLAWGADGLAWETGRLSWEGIRDIHVTVDVIRGHGWDLIRDKECEFLIDIRTGAHTGGGFNPRR